MLPRLLIVFWTRNPPADIDGCGNNTAGSYKISPWYEMIPWFVVSPTAISTSISVPTWAVTVGMVTWIVACGTTSETFTSSAVAVEGLFTTGFSGVPIGAALTPAAKILRSDIIDTPRPKATVDNTSTMPMITSTRRLREMPTLSRIGLPKLLRTPEILSNRVIGTPECY